MSMLIQNSNIVVGVVPVDLQDGANAGDWVSMKDYNRCTIVVVTAIGTAGDDAELDLNQATDNSGTSTKALTFTDIYEKIGATAISAVGQYTLTTQSASGTYTNATSAENEALQVIEVQASDLDATNDFDHIQLSIADVGGNAQLGTVLYILHEPRHAAQITPSAL